MNPSCLSQLPSGGEVSVLLVEPFYAFQPQDLFGGKEHGRTVHLCMFFAIAN